MDKIRILYLEDEPSLAKIVKESLENRDFEVFLVKDGMEALPKFREVDPDICVLDVMVPNKDGFTVGKEIRGLNPEIPILFLTAKTQTDDLLKGFSSGGNDYIRKPFSMEELVVRLNNLMMIMNSGQQNSSSTGSVHLGKYSFVPGKLELHFGDQIRKLSYRETQLLDCLCQHRNAIAERKKILKSIWGDDSYFNSRNLDVYIAKLRDYLKEDKKVQIITLKAVGYQFVTD